MRIRSGGASDMDVATAVVPPTNQKGTSMHSMLSRARGRAMLGLAIIGLATASILPATTAGASSSYRHHTPPIRVRVLTPHRHGQAGANGVFNVDVSLLARRPSANHLLSAATGYRPFFNSPTASTFGPGMPDPGAPGLVVLLSTTPAMAGGPHANLAGVFQLNAVERVRGRNRTFNDWQVGVPGFFGTNVNATLTVFVVSGTAPGHVDMSNVHPISNVARVHFHIV